jgi:hypothetical protein
MRGFTITTDLDGGKALAAARQAAVELAFAIEPVTEREFVAGKGSLGRSLLFGPFVLYCRFRISVIEFDNGEADLVVQRNFPWWAGMTGVGKVRAWMLRLVRLVESRLLSAGGKVLRSRESW